MLEAAAAMLTPATMYTPKLYDFGHMDQQDCC